MTRKEPKLWFTKAEEWNGLLRNICRYFWTFPAKELFRNQAFWRFSALLGNPFRLLSVFIHHYAFTRQTPTYRIASVQRKHQSGGNGHRSQISLQVSACTTRTSRIYMTQLCSLNWSELESSVVDLRKAYFCDWLKRRTIQLSLTERSVMSSSMLKYSSSLWHRFHFSGFQTIRTPPSSPHTPFARATAVRNYDK